MSSRPGMSPILQRLEMSPGPESETERMTSFQKARGTMCGVGQNCPFHTTMIVLVCITMFILLQFYDQISA